MFVIKHEGKNILKKCEKQNLFPDPVVVHVDFERAVITAITEYVLGQHIHIQGCFYHSDTIQRKSKLNRILWKN